MSSSRSSARLAARIRTLDAKVRIEELRRNGAERRDLLGEPSRILGVAPEVGEHPLELIGVDTLAKGPAREGERRLQIGGAVLADSRQLAEEPLPVRFGRHSQR